MSIQVSTANDVKVYNISTGKSLPEWISERKKRALLKSDEGLRRRIELIQDFKMPTAATLVKMSPDKNYIFTAGVYKPRIRCYETAQLSMKFERCVENEVVAMTMLSEDYSKFILLENNRKIEFHVQHGHYYSTRIPTFGRDMTYHSPSCDLYIAACGTDIYRLNLEQGQFLSSLTTHGRGSNVCVLCDQHQLLAAGMDNGTVECFDPRSRSRVGVLRVTDDSSPITALQFNGALTLGVGTQLGQVMLYDIRTCRPFAIKEHYYQLPIKSVDFHSNDNLVLSSDKKALRIWDSTTCTPFTTIESEYDINSVCPVNGTGLIFIAVENSQVLSYFIPSLGSAPRWCSFLDNLTEELEELPQTTVYDDYKFVTHKELDELGLSHLLGTNILRAYMHGYFMDIRLYHKARTVAQPFAFQEYRQQKIKEKIDQERVNRVQKKKLPKVNRELAKKLMAPVTSDEGKERKKGRKKIETNPLTDQRFSSLFTNPDYQVDADSNEYKQLYPILSQAMKLQDKALAEQEEELETEDEEDDVPTVQLTSSTNSTITIIKGDVQQIASLHHQSKLQLGKRLEGEDPEEKNIPVTTTASTLGNQQATFTINNKSSGEERQTEAKSTHRAERRNVRRSASTIIPKKKQGVYWKGKRIK